MTARSRLALIGVGRIGNVHARSLALLTDRSEVIVVADADEQAAKAIAETLRAARWTSNAEEAIGSADIDAVVLASPTETHAPYIEIAAGHGKDIFTEKPIALDLAATDRALDAVTEAGVRLQVGFQRRFDTGYAAAKRAIDAGEIGRIEMIRDTMRDPRLAPRSYLERSGGLYRDMTIHNFDCVRWLMGREAVAISTVAQALTDPMFAELGDVDTSVVTLTFDGGGIAMIDNSRRSGFGYDVRTEVFGSEGALFVGEQRHTPLLRFDSTGVYHDHVDWFIDRFEQAYEAELASFLLALAEDREVEVTGVDGRAALALAFAAERSLAEQRTVLLEEITGETTT